jgi:hypothetical protein
VLTEFQNFRARIDIVANVQQDMMGPAQSTKCCDLDQLSAHGQSPALIGAGVD